MSTHLIKLLSGLAFLLSPSLARSETLLRGMEVSYEVGRDQILGSVSNETVSTSHGLHLLIWSPEQEIRSGWILSGFFDLNLIRLGLLMPRSSDFPFEPDQQLTVTRSALAPTLCLQSGWLIPCFGVAYAIYDFEQSHHNEQTYGGFLYTLWLRHHFHDNLSWALKSEWGEITMRVRNNESFVEFWNSSLVLGYRF